MDVIFGEAVDRGIILRGNTLDMQWEVDLSGMPLPVARAACRYLLKKMKVERGMGGGRGDDDDIQDMVFITGIGKAHNQFRQQQQSVSDMNNNSNNVLERKDPTTSLRDYIQGVLVTDFDPPLPSTIPPRAQGTVVIDRASLLRWLERP
jgi:hypothetical protein